MGEQNKALRLTNLGHLAYRFGVQTPAGWWRRQLAEARKVGEVDGDWEQMLVERRDGLDEMLRVLRDRGFDWYSRSDAAENV